MVQPLLRVAFGRIGKVFSVLVSAMLFTLCFPPHEISWLAWFALVPFLYVLRRSSLWETVALGGLWGMAAAYGVTNWLPPTIALYYQQPLWLGMTIFLLAAAFMGAADYMAFAAFYRWWVRGSHLHPAGRWRVLPVAAAWVAAELGRARLFTGNPWGLLGYSQVGLAALDPSQLSAMDKLLVGFPQIADLAGVYGISFVVVAFNVALAEVLLAARDHSGSGRAAAELFLCLGLLASALVYGRSLAPLDPPASGAAVRVSVIQANLDLGSRWDPRFYGRNLQTYLEMTDRALATTKPQLVVWPENAMTFFVDDEPAYRKIIASVTGASGAQLIAGAPRFVNRHNPKYYNSAFLLSPYGEVLAHYDKVHLLPFTEYLPFGRFDYIRRSFGRVRSFEPGTSATLLPTVAGKAGVLICNEAMFPRLAGRRVESGAQVLVNLSNDAWVRDAGFAEQQFNLVLLRAIEQRRYMVRASTSGPSAVIAPSGRVLVKTKPFSRSTVSARIAPINLRTAYSRYGDTFAFACASWVAISLLGGLWSSKRGRAR